MAPEEYQPHQWKKNIPSRRMYTSFAERSKPKYTQSHGKFQYWLQNDSPVHHNPNQFHEGEFQKFHKFYDHDLQKDGKKSPNRVTSKLPSEEKIVIFYSHLLTYFVKISRCKDKG